MTFVVGLKIDGFQKAWALIVTLVPRASYLALVHLCVRLPDQDIIEHRSHLPACQDLMQGIESEQSVIGYTCMRAGHAPDLHPE